MFGRFDGALLGYQASDQVLLRAVAGSPVYYGDNAPFADGRFFLGASIDLSSAGKLWTGSLYAIEQKVRKTVDRRALGGEIRYQGKELQSYAGIDYDVFYGEINNAFVNGTWQASDQLTLSGGLDYRRVPFLLTSNALLGQSVDSLSQLFSLYGSGEAEALAVDRTATETSANLGLAYQFNAHWQASLDGTIAGYSGTPASGGVDAVPAPGIEYYLTARLDGSDVFTDGDYAGIGLAYIDSELYRSSIGDASLRYPLNDQWRISPRMRVAYREAKDGNTTQFLIMPSLSASYRLTDHWSFESEAAVLWEDNQTAGNSDKRTEFRVLFGYRYTF